MKPKFPEFGLFVQLCTCRVNSQGAKSSNVSSFPLYLSNLSVPGR